jgi:DNA-directed RNA polymerase subunit M/transcription elongation factor TFIIS
LLTYFLLNNKNRNSLLIDNLIRLLNNKRGGEITLKCPRCGYEFEIEVKNVSAERNEGDFEKIVDTSTTLPDYP